MRKCSAGPVHSVTDGIQWQGWGFVISDDMGNPRLTLSYSEKEDAEDGHTHVAAALVKAVVSET
jgi:hypothetical protein